MAAFDMATAISEFLTESARTSLELPQLSTGQRKNMKALIGQHPELRCESFGFGQERRLHLFKIGFHPSAAQATTEHTLRQNTLVCAPEASHQELAFLDMPLPVRNTFIHIEDVPVDKRSVQSMPHGMFSQSLLMEAVCSPSCKVAEDDLAAEVFNAKVARTPSPSSEPEAEPTVQSEQRLPFGLGALVVVEGLTKLPAFNGLSAVVQGFDHAAGRYSIMLVAANGACHQAKVKEQNLRLLVPCP